MDERAHAGRFGLRRLVAHVDGARRIMAGEHHRETRHEAVIPREAPRRGGDLLTQARRDGGAVDDAGSHSVRPSPAAFSSAAAIARGSPATRRRFTRAVAPPTIATWLAGTPAVAAMRRVSAAFAAPSWG